MNSQPINFPPIDFPPDTPHPTPGTRFDAPRNLPRRDEGIFRWNPNGRYAVTHSEIGVVDGQPRLLVWFSVAA